MPKNLDPFFEKMGLLYFQLKNQSKLPRNQDLFVPSISTGLSGSRHHPQNQSPRPARLRSAAPESTLRKHLQPQPTLFKRQPDQESDCSKKAHAVLPTPQSEDRAPVLISERTLAARDCSRQSVDHNRHQDRSRTNPDNAVMRSFQRSMMLKS